MKKIVSLFCALTLAASSLALTVSAAKGKENFGTVPATDTAITIDGKMDPIYAKGLTVETKVPVNAKSTSDSAAKAKVLWDGKDTFYVYAVIADKTVTKYAEATPKTAWETDSLEIFFDYGNDGSATQYRIDCKGVASFYEGGSIYNDAVIAKGLEKWGASDVNGGYAVEFKVKATTAVKAGEELGFCLQLNDMVDGVRQQFITHSSGKESAADYGYVVLGAEKVAPDTTAATKPAATTGSSAATFDAAIILAVAAAAAGAGVVVSKKKH